MLAGGQMPAAVAKAWGFRMNCSGAFFKPASISASWRPDLSGSTRWRLLQIALRVDEAALQKTGVAAG